MRNPNSGMFCKVGGDTGFDTINDLNIAQPLVNFLDTLDSKNSLPKTIIYNLNPKDNYTLGALIGSFQSEGIRSKIQFGSGWWYNDQKDGIKNQLMTLANLGILGNFVGMLTDSRSFISFTRHEYFRRVLCGLLGEWVEKGEYPYDHDMLKEITEGICFNNAQRYFGIEL
jgi:glucuronate isomerase